MFPDGVEATRTTHEPPSLALRCWIDTALRLPRHWATGTSPFFWDLGGPEGPEPALGSCCTAFSVGSGAARRGLLCAVSASM